MFHPEIKLIVVFVEFISACIKWHAAYMTAKAQKMHAETKRETKGERKKRR